ncbi:hypothetical protein Tco_0756455 [Tanacetum coccineum]
MVKICPSILLDLKFGTVLLIQKLLKFNLGNLVIFFYPNRLGKRIPPDKALQFKVPIANFTVAVFATLSCSRASLSPVFLLVLSHLPIIAACAFKSCGNTVSKNYFPNGGLSPRDLSGGSGTITGIEDDSVIPWTGVGAFPEHAGVLFCSSLLKRYRLRRNRSARHIIAQIPERAKREATEGGRKCERHKERESEQDFVFGLMRDGGRSGGRGGDLLDACGGGRDGAMRQSEVALNSEYLQVRWAASVKGFA